MAQGVISGIQSQGVIVNAKHWVENSQETNRHTDSAEVDERTRFELYYPPFEGAIAAGVGSVMCSCEFSNRLALYKQALDLIARFPPDRQQDQLGLEL